MITGRPREFDESEAVAAAAEAFWRQGFKGTSLGDLCSAMKISRSSFYGAFGSKEALFRRCLRHYVDAQAAAMLAELTEASDCRQFLQGVFRVAGGPTRAKGCMLMNAASEIGQQDPAIGTDISHCLKQFEAIFRQALERMKQEGRLRKKRDPATLAKYLTASLGGLKTLAKAGAKPGEIAAITDVILQAVD